MRFFCVCVFGGCLALTSAFAAHVEQACETCHLPGPPSQDNLMDEVDVLCLHCHMENVGKGEHPVGVITSVSLQPLPLHNGRVTCVTCHDPHSDTSEMLLRENGSEFCLYCHIYK